MMNRHTPKKERQEGASAMEYAIIVSLIAAVIVGSVALFGNNLSTSFSSSAVAI